MRTFRCVFAPVLFLCAFAMSTAQPQLNFKRIVNNWPAIELYFSVACDGNPAYFKDKWYFKVHENGYEIGEFELWCPDPTMRCAISVALVFDASGSMSGAGNAGAKAAGHAFVDLMDGVFDEAAVIWFTSTVNEQQSMTVNKDLLHAAINSLPANGATAVWDGIHRGVMALINDGVNQCRAVIALTDGGDNSSQRSPSEAITLANRNRVRIFTIGLGSGIQSAILQNIADLTGGRYYETPNAAQLTAIYQEISTIIFQGFQECLITYQAKCMDGSLRKVDLSLLNYCNGADTKTKTYTAPKDTTTYKPLNIRLGTVQAGGNRKVKVPLELTDQIMPPQILTTATWTVAYDPACVQFDDIKAPPGSILENVPITITPVPGGITFSTMDNKRIEVRNAPAMLAELTFTTSDPNGTDTVCCDLELKDWRFDAGCFLPALKNGRICVVPRHPVLVCDMQAPASVQWDGQLKQYSPNPARVYSSVYNSGDREGRNARFVIEYDKGELALVSPVNDTQEGTPKDVPVAGYSIGTWEFSVLPRSVADTVAVAITTSFDNHPPVRCERRIIVPKAEYPVECNVIVPALTADEAAQKYLPTPIPITVVVNNTGAATTDTLDVELVFSADLEFAMPDNPGTAVKRLVPPVLPPGQQGQVQWMLQHPISRREVQYALEARVLRKGGVESQCYSSLTVPIMRPRFQPAITVSGSTSICLGDSVLLDAGAGYMKYLWSTGDTTQTIVVKTAGVFLVTVTDIYNRVGAAPSVTISVVPPPAPRLSTMSTIPLCDGDTLVLDPGPFRDYLWNSGERTRTIRVSGAGSWYVAVTSNEGCRGNSDTVATILQPSPAKPLITRRGDSLATQAADSYQWHRNGAAIPGGDRQTHRVVSPGVYSVTVTNSFGCSAVSDPFDVTTLGIPVPRETESWTLDVYPSPARDQLVVQLRGLVPPFARVRVTDMLGRETGRGENQPSLDGQALRFDLSAQTPGLYFVTATANGEVQYRTVVKR